MADSDLSLLFRIKGDSSSAKQATAETRAAVASLKSQLGSDFNSMQRAGESALAGIGNNLNTFVGARIPLVGGSFIRLTENLKGFGGEAKKSEADLAKFDKTLDGLSQTSGKSKSQLVNFLTSFVQLETQAKRDTAAIETFGAAAAQKLIPQLEQAGTELSSMASSAEGAGASLAGVAGPIGIAVVALLAATAASALLAKEFYDLTVQTADWQGRLHDLSQQTDVSVETLATLEVALRKTGSNLDSATSSLVLFQTKLAEARDPGSAAAEMFENLGITAKDTETAFRQALKAVAALPEGVERVNAAAELFGRRGAKQLLAATNEAKGDLDALSAKLKGLNVLLSADAAQAADDFNDQLLLVQLQVRALTAALVQDSIPEILRALQAFSRVINENQEAIHTLGKAIAVFVEGNVKLLEGSLKVLSGLLKDVRDAWVATRVAALFATGSYAQAAAEIASVNAELEKLDRKGETPVPTIPALPGTTNQVSAVQRAQLTALKQYAEDVARVTQDQIAQAQLAFKQGQITRDQESAAIIKAERTRKDAALASINAEIEKQQRLRATQEGLVADQRKTDEEIEKLRQQARNLDSDFNRKVADEQNKALEDRNKAFITHIENQLSLRKKADDAEIKLIELRVKNGEILAQEGENQIEQIEDRGLEARREAIRQELKLEGLGHDERKRITQQRGELEQEATETKRQQSERRKQIAQDEIDFEKSLLLARIDTQLRLGTISDNARIASLQALSALRIRTEEETEKAVLAIRLAAIDREAEAVRAKLTAAGSKTDPKARKQEEEQLNADLRILQAERQALSEQGERDIEAGRQRDLDNLRKYHDAVKALIRDGYETESDIQRLRIQLLIGSGASRRQILEAEFREEATAAERHHAQELKRLREDYDAALEEAKTMREKLEALQAYHAAVEAVNERHRLAEQERKQREEQEKRATGPEGGFLSGLETGQLEELKNGIQSFQDIAVVAFSAVGAAVNGLAQGIGGLVENWVLMGSTGPNAMRKLVASVLAGVAAQSAVLAIFELAKGFASLFFNPAEAAAHFQAAALFGSIAVATAVAGRGVAGDLFKQPTAGAGGTSKTGSSGSTRTTPEVTDINRRNAQPVINITVVGQATEGFRYMVEKVAVQSVRLNGPFRKIQNGEDV